MSATREFATDFRAKRFPENLPPGWHAQLKDEVDLPYFQNLTRFLNQEYLNKKKIFPPRNLILRALQSVDLHDIKVVILGQDPYHGQGQAIGLSFAVPNQLRIKPPSLVNIFKEIESDSGKPVDRTKSELSSWVDQGVLLLNTVLTVQEASPLSHRDKGWEVFTDKIIQAISNRTQPVIFLLWGSPAQSKIKLIDTSKHFVLKAPHPSPLSAHRGFLGCKHFSKANQILTQKLGKTPIDWTITS